ncbi:hypothetical protein BKA58DRAFT_473070 [Alternaria rosae]|uniref:uncharacterized protein n=1 Tax=Alternaria rosae TaxID=1187941 RepID=UPI001E8CC2BC|nr:uncharacterized protein BKA58DRAFT_473070 [Alternaria rosae]KAH6858941.1 hypothetical protein BKA58DRAFT_473070 [Alternaria rosae]
MNSTASAGNHLRVRTPNGKPEDDQKGSEQVFFQSAIPGRQGLDIASSPRGQWYVGGWANIPEELQQLAKDMHAQSSEIENMKEVVKRCFHVPEDEDWEIFAEGRCYRPLTTFEHPIMTKVDWDLVSMGESSQAMPLLSKQKGDSVDGRYEIGGLFLKTAHFDDGITLSLESGKVMSELLLYLPPSVDVWVLGMS